MTKRQLYNIQILNTLMIIVGYYPDLRFHQILQNFGVVNREDKFYEESEKTYKKLLEKFYNEIN